MEADWQTIGSVGVYSLSGLLCLLAFLLSCLSLSGTWVVFGVAGLLAWRRWPEFPGIGTLLLFLILCIAVEVAEALAGAWGVKKRGGSKAAGWAAIVGGFLGLLFGGLIPVPVIGNLLGMLIGSFSLAFAVEHAKIKQTEQAVQVATGAVIARLAVIFLKVGITVAMTLVLAIGIAAT